MQFRLDVVRGRSVPKVIQLDAPTAEAARLQAVEMGYAVLTLRASGIGLHHFLPKPRRASFAAVVFIEQLRDLLQAGLSAIEALTALQQAANLGSRRVLDALIAHLRGGDTLSRAMASLPHFPDLLIALVGASELTSDLPQALSRFLDHEQRVAELRHRIASVAIYPLALVGVGTGVLLFLLLYVMPRFARVFEGMTSELPWSARAMVWWSQWLGAHWPWLIVLAALLGIAVGGVATTGSARAHALRALLTWAPLRERLRLYFLSQWYRATGMLVEGGIPLPQALVHSNTLLPPALRKAGECVQRGLHDGYSPAQAYARADMTTPVAEQLMHAGERTGDLGSILTRIAQFHETEVARSLERGMRTLEPLVMVLIGLGVGTVVVLMYLPIFELAAAIS